MQSATNKIDAVDITAFLGTGGHAPDVERGLRVAGWKDSDWTTLFSYTTPTELKTGEVLIEQSAEDRALYFAVSGKLKVAVLDEADSSVTDIATISPGSVVGEFSFFDGGPRSAKVWAATPCRLLKLTLQEFERYRRDHLDAASHLLFAMARLLAIRVRNANTRS